MKKTFILFSWLNLPLRWFQGLYTKTVCTVWTAGTRTHVWKAHMWSSDSSWFKHQLSWMFQRTVKVGGATGGDHVMAENWRKEKYYFSQFFQMKIIGSESHGRLSYQDNLSHFVDTINKTDICKTIEFAWWENKPTWRLVKDNYWFLLFFHYSMCPVWGGGVQPSPVRFVVWQRWTNSEQLGVTAPVKINK